MDFSISDVFKKAGSYATSAFDWIESNPETADMIAGIVEGAATAYVTVTEGEANRKFAEDEAEKDRQHQEAMLDKQNQNQLDAQKITPVTAEDYGSHGGQITDGLITSGMVAGKQKKPGRLEDRRRHRFQ